MRPFPTTLVETAGHQNGLFTRRQARDAGIADSTLDDCVGHAIMRVLPTVYTTFTGHLTTQQRLRAAALYGRIGGRGTVAILGGLAACHLHGLRAAADAPVVQLLLPHKRRLADSDFVVVRRAASLGSTWQLAGLPVCAPPRAIVDAARRMRRLDQVRELVAEGVQTGKATTDELANELPPGGSAGSRLTRVALAEVADGVRSVAEAKLRQLLAGRGFPAAIWNADLYDEAAGWLARPDAIWPEAALIVEVESREWHLSPADWAATMRRTNRLSRLGYDVQQLPPSRIAADPDSVIADLTAAYAAGLARAHTGARPLVTIRAAGGPGPPGAAGAA